MQTPPLTKETLLRNLPYVAVTQLAETLDINNLWEKLASKIPTKPDFIFKPTDANFKPRYTMTDIARFGSSKNSSTTALIRDWGIQNSRVKHLIEALNQANLKAAAACLQEHILYTESERLYPESENNFTNSGLEYLSLQREMPPCSQSTIAGSVVFSSEGQKLDDPKVVAFQEDVPTSDSEQFHEISDELKCFKIEILKEITNNFDPRSFKDGGNLIGEGGFGRVFIGTFSSGLAVAVKCLKDGIDNFQQFQTEVETLTTFKHENLVHLLGYSVTDNDSHCLVYQYMSNGSLEERLACQYDTEPLSNNIRLAITKGTAKGIAFLHSGGLVHRDIKSANILLDYDFTPKVGDFATARVLPMGMTSHIMKASVIIGTAAYLAPEAISFKIHPSLDVYSFGVVILEILTGLPVTDPNRAEADLKFHVQEHCSEGEDGEEPGQIYDLLDDKGGLWCKNIVDELYSISCHCLEHARRKRPVMADIVTELERLELIYDKVDMDI